MHLSVSSRRTVRIYRDLFLLLIAGCGSSLTTGTIDFLAQLDIPAGSNVISAWNAGIWAASAYIALRLAYLVVGHTPWRPALKARIRRVSSRTAMAILATATITTGAPAVARMYPLLSSWLFYASLAWLAVETCRHHGISPADLGLGTRRLRDQVNRKAAARLTWYGMFVGTLGTTLLLQGLRLTGADDYVPVLAGDQAHTLGLDSLGALLLLVTGAVVMEDLVVVGATAALLTSARSPLWVAYVLITVIEVWLHAYFGLPAIGMAVYAVLRIIAYQRTRQLLTLMGLHAAWDTITSVRALAHLTLYQAALVAIALGTAASSVHAISIRLRRGVKNA